VTTTYEYDSNLRLKKETTGSQSISYTYDKYNRLTKKSYSIDGTVLTFSYTYNSNGQMATQTFPDGMIETYTYDANGYLTLITMGGQKVWELKSNTGTQRTVHLGTTPLVLTTSYDFNDL
jgi:RHS Repeat.